MNNDEVKKFIHLANNFITENPNGNVDEFIKYLFTNFSTLINKRNINKRKLANKAFEFVQNQRASNIEEREWIFLDTYIYRDEDKTDAKDELNASNKRKLEDIDDIAPNTKRQKIKSFPTEKDFHFYSTEQLEMLLRDFIEFPESLYKKIDIDIAFQKMHLKILVSGPAKCGKSTFIYHLAQKYNYQYILVGKRYIENMDVMGIEQSIKGLGEGFEKVLFHFKFNKYPTKISENFQMECIASSKYLMIFESNDPDTLKNTSDSFIRFPVINKLDRQKYLEHFLFDNEKFNSDNCNCEKMARLTPGYQIGHIKSLCIELQKAITINPAINIEAAFIDIIKSGQIKDIIKTDEINWSDIGGHDEVKEKLKNIMNNVKDATNLFKSNGVILYGPPGCGKTMLAKALSNEHEFSFVSISCTDILSKYQGESEKNVRDVFNLARSCQPCILFIDEIDALCSQRGDENSGSRNTIVNTFLTEIDGIDSHKNTQLLVIGATNFIEKIDKAISRSGRLGRLIEVNIPKSPQQRFSVLMAASKNGTSPKFVACSLDEEDFSVENIFRKFASDDFTEGWNHSDLAALITESYQVMKNDPNTDSSNCVTMIHVLSAHCVKNREKKINISPKFNKYAKSILAEELEQKFPNNFQFTPYVMDQVEEYAGNEQVIIGGGHFSGKSSLIVMIAKKYQYNLVTFDRNYFNKFQLDKFTEEITKFVKKNGPTLIHIDEREISEGVYSELSFFKIDLAVMLVFETLSIEYADLVIPAFSREKLKGLFQDNTRNQINENEIEKYLDRIPHWGYGHFNEFAKKFKSHFHGDEVINRLINQINKRFK